MMWVAWLWLIGAAGPAAGLLLLPPSGRLACFILAVLLETGHSLSPIVLAWSHSEFRRQVMIPSPRKFVLLPGLLLAMAAIVGVITSAGLTTYQLNAPHQMMKLTDWTNPFPILIWSYLIWNAYHFGMQNYGVLALVWKTMPQGARRFDLKVACVLLTAAGMYALPTYANSWALAMICVGVFSFNHWIVAIGLCSRVSAHSWIFMGGVLAAGAIGFAWMIPTSDSMMMRVIPYILGARAGLGFVHFLYDRWIWKMSDPLVRGTIGKELLA